MAALSVRFLENSMKEYLGTAIPARPTQRTLDLTGGMN